MNPPRRADVVNTVAAEIRENTADPGDPGWVRVELVYGMSDPCAVWFLIGEECEDRAAWVVSRDLLAAGVASPSGDGDVHVFPERSLLVVRLQSPEGRFVFTVPRDQVARFLRSTFQVVRPGRENVTADIDEAIARMRPGQWSL